MTKKIKTQKKDPKDKRREFLSVLNALNSKQTKVLIYLPFKDTGIHATNA